MGGGARVRGVARIINHFTEELMVLTLRLEEVAVALEDMLEWSEFKFVFKGATSKVVSCGGCGGCGGVCVVVVCVCGCVCVWLWWCVVRSFFFYLFLSFFLS